MQESGGRVHDQFQLSRVPRGQRHLEFAPHHPITDFCASILCSPFVDDKKKVKSRDEFANVLEDTDRPPEEIQGCHGRNPEPDS